MIERETEARRVAVAPDGDVIEERTYDTAPVAAPATTVVAPTAAAVDQTRATAYDPFATRRSQSHRLVQAIWLLFGIVEGLLAIRFILKLLGANPEAGFANLIYSASGPFIAPFFNLFNNPGGSGSVLELNTLVAIVVYMLVAWLVAKVVWLMAGESRTAATTVASSTRTRVD